MTEDIKFTDLNSIRIAKPCHASWNDMQQVEGDRVRHCSECHLNVYNLSEMTRREAVKLVQEYQGHLCVKFYRRKDGTILTQDCPVGEQAAQRTFSKRLLRVLTLLLDAFLSLPSISRHIPAHDGFLGEPEWEDKCPSELEDIWREEKEQEIMRRELEVQRIIAENTRRSAEK